MYVRRCMYFYNNSPAYEILHLNEVPMGLAGLGVKVGATRDGWWRPLGCDFPGIKIKKKYIKRFWEWSRVKLLKAMENFLMMLLSGELSNRLNTNCSLTPRCPPQSIYIYIYGICVYIWLYIYLYLPLAFLGMYSWILYLYLLALPVGKLWKWNARHVPRKSLRLRRNAGAFDGWRPLSMNPKVILAMQNIRKLHKLCTLAKKYHMPYFGTPVQWYFQSYLVTCPINTVLGFRLLVA